MLFGFQTLENPIPKAILTPQPKPFVNRLPRPKPLGQVAPRRSGGTDPENAIDHQAMIFPLTASFPISWKQIQDLLVLSIT